jgi:mobilome CxxCx(11)CxxC protein
MKQTIEEQLEEANIDAHCAVSLHKAHIAKYEKLLTAVDALSVCVPVGFFGVQVASIQFPAVATFLASVINPLLSAALLILVLFTLVTQSRAKLKQHQRFLSEEIIVIREIKELLSGETITSEATKRILDWAARLAQDEEQMFSKLSELEKRNYYRLGLRAIGDPTVVCPICGASPYHYQKPQKNEMCQTCGNTPGHQLTRGTEYELGS